jgi:hypothetical protein
VATRVKPKRSCCRSRPRCKRCPVVLNRLERAGLATGPKKGKQGFKLSPKLTKADVKAARRR